MCPEKSEDGFDGMSRVDHIDLLCIRADDLGKTAGGQDSQVLSVPVPESLDQFVGHSAIALENAGFHAFLGASAEEGFCPIR